MPVLLPAASLLTLPDEDWPVLPGEVEEAEAGELRSTAKERRKEEVRGEERKVRVRGGKVERRRRDCMEIEKRGGKVAVIGEDQMIKEC
jgi:hypothetical protein